VALVAALAACTTAQPEPTASAPDASSASPTATTTPAPTASIDPAETTAWAAGTVPTSGADGFILAQNGQFQGDAPGSFSLTASTLPAGSYSVYLACRGDADTTVTLSANNDAGTTLTSGCSDLSSGITFSTTSDGTEFTLLSDSEAPVEWALAVTELLPGAEG
jgi:uncharacterized lipoprotein